MLTNKITILNDTTIECLNEIDEIKIIKAFMDVGLKILEADFGFVWLNSSKSNKLELVYQSDTLPFTPHIPRKNGRNYNAIKNATPDFITETKKVADAQYISKYVKSFVIIPIVYKKTLYGSMVVCFKKRECFSPEKKTISAFMGSSVAQTITINRLIISERNARLQSEKQKYHFRALVENSYEIITQINSEGQILSVSSSIKKILGIHPKDLVGKHIQAIINDNSNETSAASYVHNIIHNPKNIHDTEFHFTKKDGSVVFLEATATNMLRDPNVGVIVINVRNITERKKFEQMKETSRQLQEEKLKVEFIADATHELRTPLAIMKGNIDLALLDTKKDGKLSRKTFKLIDSEIKHLSSIVSDLGLITSPKENSQHKIDRQKVNLTALLADVKERCTPLAYKKNISITLDTAQEQTLWGDQDYLEKMFLNLVKNSINYGNIDGHTTISIKKSKGFISILICDDGIGIPERDLPHIFERFYRADKFYHAEGTSTGLGLAIVKWVAEIHGGEISVKRNKTKGTTFTVTLPTAKVVHTV